MTAKTIRKFGIFSIGAILTAFGLLPARLSAQLLTLTGGTTTDVAQSDAVCVTYLTINNGNDATALDAVKDHGCTGNRLIMDLFTGVNLLPHKVDITGIAQFVVQFQVKAVQGAATSSFVPILIGMPVEWHGVLFNDSAVPPIGVLDPVGAHVDVNMFLRLTQGQPGDPARPTVAVTANRINGASHGGVFGCATVPSGETAISVANVAVKCALAVFERNEGSGTIFLSSIVETGKTYNIELELRSDLFSLNAGVLKLGGLGGHPRGNFEANVFTNTPFGLKWTDPMSITVGTDFQSNIQGLQDEITQLRADLNNLSQEFKTHTHVYLTGKGVGQNNTPAKTSTPLFPPLPLFP